jgi:hypothetical protein
MTEIKQVLITFLETMRDDLKRRSFDESGEQKAETEGRIEELKALIEKLKGGAK